jgi:hypothetical protein
MKFINTLLAFLWLSGALQAEELVQTVTFAEEPLTISSAPGEQVRMLIELPNPGISSPVYALKGRIRYEDVEGEGFLQMDNNFGDLGTFFTKTVAPEGPLGAISGSSDWRAFVLPFYANSGDPAVDVSPVPEKLTLTLFLPGSGTVSIGDVALYQYAPGEDPLTMTGAWFDSRTAGLLGGIGGTLLGVWGALIGIAASRGKARGFVLGSASAMLGIGMLSLIGGVVALAMSQPYAVYYTLFLFGIILVAVIGSMRRSLAARYEQLELKRIQSMDA